MNCSFYLGHRRQQELQFRRFSQLARRTRVARIPSVASSGSGSISMAGMPVRVTLETEIHIEKLPSRSTDVHEAGITILPAL